MDFCFFPINRHLKTPYKFATICKDQSDKEHIIAWNDKNISMLELQTFFDDIQAE